MDTDRLNTESSLGPQKDRLEKTRLRRNLSFDRASTALREVEDGEGAVSTACQDHWESLRLPDNELMHGDNLGLISKAIWAQRSTFWETILQILNKQQK